MGTLTVLDIANRVAPRVGVTAPSSVVGNTEQTAALILADIRAAAADLLEMGVPWTFLVEEHTFSTVDGQPEYDLPSDYHSLVDGTIWDRTNFDNLRSGLTPHEWQIFKSSALGSDPALRRWRIRQNAAHTLKFEVLPTPTTVDELVFEYLSTEWAVNSGGARIADITADTDTLVFPDNLILAEVLYRVLDDSGFASQSKEDKADRIRNQVIAKDGGPGKTIDLTFEPSFKLIGPDQVPDAGFGS